MNLLRYFGWLYKQAWAETKQTCFLEQRLRAFRFIFSLMFRDEEFCRFVSAQADLWRKAREGPEPVKPPLIKTSRHSKHRCHRCASVFIASGLSSATLTDVIVAQHGSVTAIEMVQGNGESYFIKQCQNLIEVGGTLDWGTGKAAF